MRKQASTNRPNRYEALGSWKSQRPSAAAAPSRPLQGRRLLIAFCGSLFGFVLYRRIYKTNAVSDDLVPQDFDFSDRFDATAGQLDKDVDFVEWLYGITKLRRKLVQQAHGNVFEAAVGTGRNSEFYDLRRITSLTLQDQSEEMLKVAKAKWRQTHPAYEHCRFIHGSALEPLPRPTREKTNTPQDEGYDTIIATMSLCSTPGPSLFLRSLAGHLSVGDVAAEDDGSEHEPARILLLEHGRSYYSLLNYLLDRTALAHAQQHGCWWNRDIGKIVEESGLEVISTKRQHFGTTWALELGLPAEAKGVKRQKWLEDSRQKIAVMQADVAEAHVKWKERMRKQEEARRKEEALEAWRREQREEMKPKEV